jgi:mRNA-degrading endonuclease RelE of RelBE toxin-antitoxin system
MKEAGFRNRQSNLSSTSCFQEIATSHMRPPYHVPREPSITPRRHQSNRRTSREKVHRRVVLVPVIDKGGLKCFAPDAGVRNGDQGRRLAALRGFPEDLRRQIGYALHRLQEDFTGDVKKLKGSKNEYRLRVGDHRVLFDRSGDALWFIVSAHEKTFTNEHCHCQKQSARKAQFPCGSADCAGKGLAPPTA